MLDKKQIQAIFLFEFKMDCKAAETTGNINNASGPGTTNEHKEHTVVVQEVLQRRWEFWRWGSQCPAIGSWQRPIERITKADPLTTTWEVPKELSVDHYHCSAFEANWKGEKVL